MDLKKSDFGRLISAVWPAVIVILAICSLMNAAEDNQQANLLAEQINSVLRNAVGGVQPAVVYLGISKNLDGEPFGQDKHSVGSGCIIDSRGYVITNEHVVRDTDQIVVRLSDGRYFEAVEVLVDPDTDLALIRIDPQGEELPVARFGDSDAAQVGDLILVVGNPFGLEQTVTSGIISYKGRQTNVLDAKWGYEDFIQTDADVNRGNSGGPLVNLYGRVIGINSNIYSPTLTGTSVGYSFAIPSNICKFVVEQLIENGQVKRGYLGISMNKLSLEQLRKMPREQLERAVRDDLLNIIDSLQDTLLRGVLVSTVEPDGPADRAGIIPDDVITAINGEQMTSPKQLRNLIAGIAPGEQITCKLARGGEELTMKIILGDRQIAKDQRTAQQEYDQQPKLGVRIRMITPQLAAEFGYQPETTDGVIIVYVQPGSLAEQNGLQAGDIILSIDGHDIYDTSQVAQLAISAEMATGMQMKVLNHHGTFTRVVKQQAD